MRVQVLAEWTVGACRFGATVGLSATRATR
jgi:hypothetical protein